MSDFKGIKGNIRKPRALEMIPIKQRSLYFERSSAVTPTNFSFSQTPTIGERTLLARLVVPVKNAKTVPSILVGVIFANNARVGSVFIAKLITPNTVSVNKIKAISLTPINRLNLTAKAYCDTEEITDMTVDQ